MQFFLNFFFWKKASAWKFELDCSQKKKHVLTAQWITNKRIKMQSWQAGTLNLSNPYFEIEIVWLAGFFDIVKHNKSIPSKTTLWSLNRYRKKHNNRCQINDTLNAVMKYIKLIPQEEHYILHILHRFLLKSSSKFFPLNQNYILYSSFRA